MHPVGHPFLRFVATAETIAGPYFRTIAVVTIRKRQLQDYNSPLRMQGQRRFTLPNPCDPNVLYDSGFIATFAYTPGQLLPCLLPLPFNYNANFRSSPKVHSWTHYRSGICNPFLGSHSRQRVSNAKIVLPIFNLGDSPAGIIVRGRTRLAERATDNATLRNISDCGMREKPRHLSATVIRTSTSHSERLFKEMNNRLHMTLATVTYGFADISARC